MPDSVVEMVGYPEAYYGWIQERYGSYALSISQVLQKYDPGIIRALRLYSAQGELEDILIYAISRGTCELINQLVDISAGNQERFCRHIFDRNPAVRKISLVKQATPLREGAIVVNQDVTDLWIELPHTREQYGAMLGKKTRKRLNHARKIFQEDFPEANIVMNVDCRDVDETLWRTIIRLKEKRQRERGRQNTFTEEKLRKERSIYQEIGKLSIIWDGDTLVSALLYYQVGRVYFARAIAYNMKYAKYSAGRLLIYLSILDAIDRGGTQYHLLWKGSDYLEHFGCSEMPLYDAFVFRSENAFWLMESARMRIKKWLRKVKAGPVGQCLIEFRRKVKALGWAKRRAGGIIPEESPE